MKTNKRQNNIILVFHKEVLVLCFTFQYNLITKRGYSEHLWSPLTICNKIAPHASILHISHLMFTFKYASW